MTPQHTLGALKKEIAKSSALGRVPLADQRIFHLGRELKTRSRSLDTLGIGRFGVNVVHVHSKRPRNQQQPTTETIDSSDSDDAAQLVGSRKVACVDLLSSDDEVEVEDARKAKARTASSDDKPPRRNKRQRNI